MSFHGVRVANAVNRRCSLNDELLRWYSPLPQLAGGDKWYDISGRGKDGTATGTPAWVAGHRGMALEFDGDNDVVDITGITTTGGKFSVMWWQNPIQDNASSYVLDSQTGRLIILTRYSSSDAVHFYDGAYSKAMATTAYGVWACYCLVLNATTASLYRDGVFVDSDGFSGVNLGATTKIGARYAPTATTYYTGLLNGLAIWDRVLSASEVQQLYSDSQRYYQRTLNRTRGVAVGVTAPPAFGGTNQIIGGGLIGV